MVIKTIKFKANTQNLIKLSTLTKVGYTLFSI